MFSESGINIKICLSAITISEFYLVYTNAKTFNLFCLYLHHKQLFYCCKDYIVETTCTSSTLTEMQQ